MGAEIRFRPSGDCALTVEFGDRIDRTLNARVMALHAALAEYGPDGVIETVPTFRSLLVHYDPLRLPLGELRDQVNRLVSDDLPEPPVGRTVSLPVCYGGEHGPDLDQVAETTGLTAEAVVQAHAGVEHYVYMIGFAPGHPYLGDLPTGLNLSRRETPRTRVPSGTVAIAIGQTVIYPFDSPSGWHAIGRTPVPLFDIDRSPPAILGAGDRVHLEAIDAARYDAIVEEVAAGHYVFS